eukprot:6572142-Prymnesium_polylepis.1
MGPPQLTSDKTPSLASGSRGTSINRGAGRVVPHTSPSAQLLLLKGRVDVEHEASALAVGTRLEHRDIDYHPRPCTPRARCAGPR